MDIDPIILKFLSEHIISEQSDLIALLKDEGIQVTQSTLSRHFRRLSVAKLDGRYRHMKANKQAPTPYVVEAAPPNIILAWVGPGQASPVALKLDQSDIDGLLGTVAGDDTIIIVVRPPEKLLDVKKQVQEFLSNLTLLKA